MEDLTSKKSHTPAPNVENNSKFGDMSKNEMTFQRAPLEGTPFTVLYDKENGYSAGIVNTQMTSWYEKEEELLEKLRGTSIGQLDWDLITGTITVIVAKALEMQKLENLRELNKLQEEINQSLTKEN